MSSELRPRKATRGRRMVAREMIIAARGARTALRRRERGSGTSDAERRVDEVRLKEA